MRTACLLLLLTVMTSCYQELPLFVTTLPIKYDPVSSPTLAATHRHSCAIQRGSLFCWGANTHGQLGLGDRDPRDQPTQVGVQQDWTALAIGDTHTCATRAGGILYCWGQHNVGQLGPGRDVSDDAVSLEPIPVQLATPVAALSGGDSGSNYTCAILRDGTLWCWGANGEAQIAQGTSNLTGTSYYDEPQRVLDITNWTQVSSSQGHTCALQESGELWCWGRNNHGECCANSTDRGEVTTPQKIAPPETGRTWSLVEVSNNHTCALDDLRRMWCWGQNNNWQFGKAEPETSKTPLRIPLDVLATGEHVVAISSDTFNMCVRTNKNQAWCWGSNFSGQFGAGHTPTMEPPQNPPPMGFVPPRRTPMRVFDGDVLDISMGRFHGCIRTQNDRILCAGNSADGRLGIPADGDKSTWLEITIP